MTRTALRRCAGLKNVEQEREQRLGRYVIGRRSERASIFILICVRQYQGRRLCFSARAPRTRTQLEERNETRGVAIQVVRLAELTLHDARGLGSRRVIRIDLTLRLRHSQSSRQGCVKVVRDQLCIVSSSDDWRWPPSS